MSFFDQLGSGIASAGSGALVGGAASLLGGLFGSKPKIPKELKRLYDFQYNMARQQQNYAKSIPLSDPQEQAALASQRGLLGEGQRQQTGQLQSQYGMVNQGTNGVGDFLTNINNQYTGQQSALTADALQNSLLARRQALNQASQFGQAARGAVDYQQQPGLGPGFGELARLIAYNQTLHAGARQGQQGGQGQQGPLTTPGMGNLPSAGIPLPPPPGPTPQDPTQLRSPDMGNLPGYGMRNPFTPAALGNPTIAQVSPGLSAQNRALNR